MTTYRTGNPIGSKDPRDLYDNAENLDSAVNSTDDTWTDRFGKVRPTLKGATDPSDIVQGAIDAAEQASEDAGRAETAAGEAENARDATLLAISQASLDVYETVQEGMSGTAQGEFFIVVGEGGIQYYLNDDGEGELVASVPTAAGVHGIYPSVEDGEQTTRDGDTFAVVDDGVLQFYKNVSGTADPIFDLETTLDDAIQAAIGEIRPEIEQVDRDAKTAMSDFQADLELGLNLLDVAGVSDEGGSSKGMEERVSLLESDTADIKGDVADLTDRANDVERDLTELTSDFERHIEAGDIVYLTIDQAPTTSMKVHWWTPVDSYDSMPIVYYRQHETGLSWEFATGHQDNMMFNEDIKINHVLLENLEPGTVYEFRLGQKPSGQIRKFKTIRDDLEEDVLIVNGGDSSPLGEDYYDMNEVVASLNPDLIVFGGDWFYDANEERWLNRVLVRMAKWSQQLVRRSDGCLIPHVSALGNHEVDPHNGLLDLTGIVDNPERDGGLFWQFVNILDQPVSRTHYQLNFGNYLKLLILDSGHLTSFENQVSFIESSLSDASNFTHIIPVYHVPAWPGSRNHNNRSHRKVREEWVPLFEAHAEINLVLEHHDHVYKKTVPIFEGEEDHTRGIVYIGDGRWSGAVRDVWNPATTWYLASSYGAEYKEFNETPHPDDGTPATPENGKHIHLIRLTETEKTIETYRTDGTMFDTFTISNDARQL